MTPSPSARWRTSSFSGDNNECVEIANTLDEIRDSKNATGQTLRADVRHMVRRIQSGYMLH